MRKSKQCPKCESLRIGYLASLPDEGGEAQAISHYGVAQK